MGTLLTPPAYGTDTKSVWSYLYTMHQELEQALNSLTPDQFASPETAAVIRELTQTGETAKQAADMSRQADVLRSLIIKTADTVQARMDQLQQTLTSEYVANSTFGQYQEQARNDLEATANGIVQNFTYTSETTPLKEGMTDFLAYMVTTQAYIKTGLLTIDGQGQPVYGVAVGENMREITTTLDGVPVKIVDPTTAMAMFTARELSFWSSGQKIAWFSNTELHVNKLHVENYLAFGNLQAIYEQNGMVRWAVMA